MKLPFFILIILPFFAWGQPDSTRVIKIKQSSNNLDNLIKAAISDYYRTDKIFEYNKGIIVLKINEITEKKIDFSISYILNRTSYFYLQKVTNYFDFKGRLVLIIGGNYQNLLKEMCEYNFFTEKIYFSKKYLYLTNPITKFSIREWWIVSVVKAKNGRIKIKYYINYKLPDKYKMYK